MCQRALLLLLPFLTFSYYYCYLLYGEKTNVMCFVLCGTLSPSIASGAYVFNLISVADIQLQDVQ